MMMGPRSINNKSLLSVRLPLLVLGSLCYEVCVRKQQNTEYLPNSMPELLQEDILGENTEDCTAFSTRLFSCLFILVIANGSHPFSFASRNPFLQKDCNFCVFWKKYFLVKVIYDNNNIKLKNYNNIVGWRSWLGDRQYCLQCSKRIVNACVFRKQ